jgi:uncharacterized OB-fold protein
VVERENVSHLVYDVESVAIEGQADRAKRKGGGSVKRQRCKHCGHKLSYDAEYGWHCNRERCPWMFRWFDHFFKLDWT